MAKKQKNLSEEIQRQSRKEILQKRKEQEQKRTIYIAASVVAGLLLILFLYAIISEFLIAPNRTVAEVGEEVITLREWQERVRFERAQRIALLESQLEQFGDVSLIQQFYEQVIVQLRQPEVFGQTVKNQMVEDLAVLQAAEDRGITVTDDEIDEWIAESFGYFGGELPTPFPTPTETIMPTPSLTPIPTAVITELLPTTTPFPTFTPGPTQPPPPTATPKSEAAFEQEFTDFLADYEAYGITEAQYRDFVRMQLYRSKVADALAEEQELPTSAEHTSFLFMGFESEDEANEALEQISSVGFLQLWNEIRSGAVVSDEDSTAIASEILWRPQADIEQTFGTEVAESAFNMPLEEPSPVLVQVVDAETSRYYIVYLTGREVRDLTESAIEQEKFEALSGLIDVYLSGNLTYTDLEQGRAPDQPSLDPIFYTVQPTEPAPLAVPTVPDN